LKLPLSSTHNKKVKGSIKLKDDDIHISIGAVRNLHVLIYI